MSTPVLLQHLCEWIEASCRQPGLLSNLHCFRMFSSVPLPDGGTVSAVSVRHQTSSMGRAPDQFVAEIWNLCHGSIRTADVKEMCLALATFRAWYSGILEEAEVAGLRPRHRFSVHGNLIGVSVEPAATVDLLSHHGGEVAFWTYRVSAGRTVFDPHYGEDQSVSRSELSPMLDHLAWEEVPLSGGDRRGRRLRRMIGTTKVWWVPHALRKGWPDSHSVHPLRPLEATTCVRTRPREEGRGFQQPRPS